MTRNNKKIVFKTRIGTNYDNSPFYRGTKLWNKLSLNLQFSDDIFMFKTQLSKQYKVFRGRTDDHFIRSFSYNIL